LQKRKLCNKGLHVSDALLRQLIYLLSLPASSTLLLPLFTAPILLAKILYLSQWIFPSSIIYLPVYFSYHNTSSLQRLFLLICPVLNRVTYYYSTEVPICFPGRAFSNFLPLTLHYYFHCVIIYFSFAYLLQCIVLLKMTFPSGLFPVQIICLIHTSPYEFTLLHLFQFGKSHAPNIFLF